MDNLSLVGLCSESFTEKENLILSDGLKKLGIENYLKKVEWGNKYRISIKCNYSNYFFSVIGKCPVNSMEYKWKILV